MTEITPDPSLLSEPYVLRLIEELAKRDDEIEALRDAVSSSVLALNDWLNTYADDLVSTEAHQNAWIHISENGGTLSYIAKTQERNLKALGMNKL